MADLALLADDGDLVVEFDVIEERFEEDVGDADEVVVLLGLVERVAFLWRTSIL